MANIKLSKTQLHKIGQSGGFLCRLLVPLVQAGLPLLGNIPKPLAKSVLIPLGLMAAASATDAAIHKKLFGSGFTTLIISNEEMEDIMKIVKSLEDSGLLIKGVSETIKNKAKEKKEDFSECYQALYVLVYWEIYYQVKEQLEQMKIFNSAPSFN